MNETPTRTRKPKRTPADRPTTVQCTMGTLDRLNRAAKASGAVGKPMLMDALVTLWERTAKSDPEACKAVMKEKLDAYVGQRLRGGR